jgi:predicted DNA-binding transcriptional regulator AlpA
MELNKIALIKPSELAEMIGVSVSRLAQWRMAGHGPKYIKLSAGKSGAIRYRMSDVQEWINESEVAE